jgi:hypothetical protein
MVKPDLDVGKFVEAAAGMGQHAHTFAKLLAAR